MSTTSPHPRPWIIVGAGRLGRTLGLLAERLDRPVRCTWNRSVSRRRETASLVPAREHLDGPLDVLGPALGRGAAVVWLTVSDDAISEVAAELAQSAPSGLDAGSGTLVLHCAGSLSSRIMREAGIEAPVGSLHPLLAVTDPRAALERLGEASWTVEGDDAAVAFAREVMAQIGIEPTRLDPSVKALYHASAVTAANLLVGLIDGAFEMASAAGLDEATTRAMLLPLARSCLDNLANQRPSQALSGPAARGDDATIERHRRALAELGEEDLVRLYEVLTERALQLAGRR
jgi:predicted short-subunit dehydrogenase-like oxidoreductase (DUF2520 family)